jgi:archaellum component FlaC
MSNELEQNRLVDIYHIAKPDVTINVISMVSELEKYHMTGADLVKDVAGIEKYLGSLPKDFTSLNDAISSIKVDIDTLYSDVKSFKKDFSLVYADLKSDVDCIKSIVHIPYIDNFTSPINILNTYITKAEKDVSSLTDNIKNLNSKVSYDINNITNEVKSRLNTYFADIIKEYKIMDKKFQEALTTYVDYKNTVYFPSGSAYFSYKVTRITNALFLMKEVTSQVTSGQRQQFVAYIDLSNGHEGLIINNNEDLSPYQDPNKYDFFYVGAIPKDQPDISISVIDYRSFAISHATRMVTHTIGSILHQLSLMFVNDVKESYSKLIGLIDEIPEDIKYALSTLTNYSSYLGDEFGKYEKDIYTHGSDINQISKTEINKIVSSIKAIESPCKTSVSYSSTSSSSSTSTSPPPLYTVTFNETGVPNANIWHIQIVDSKGNIIKNKNEEIIHGRYVNTYSPITVNLPSGSYKVNSWYSPPNKGNQQIQVQSQNITIPNQLSYKFIFKTSSTSSSTSSSTKSTTSSTQPVSYKSGSTSTTYKPYSEPHTLMQNNNTVESLIEENKSKLIDEGAKTTVKSLISEGITSGTADDITGEAVDTAVLSQNKVKNK